MLRRFYLLAILLLTFTATGCSALGIEHPLTGIVPAGYTTKRVDSELVNAVYEVESESTTGVEFASR